VHVLALTSLLTYRLSLEILQGIIDYANQQYLVALQDELKRVRLLYEEGKIKDDEYGKLEKALAEAIKNLRTEQSKAGWRQIDITLV
jgi:hypothetical protein